MRVRCMVETHLLLSLYNDNGSSIYVQWRNPCSVLSFPNVIWETTSFMNWTCCNHYHLIMQTEGVKFLVCENQLLGYPIV